MLKYKQINVNPKNRKTGDCSTRALCACLSISYDDAMRLQYEEAFRCYYDPTSKQVMERVLSKFGYIKMKQPKTADGKKYEVKDLDKIISKEQLAQGVFVTVSNHHTCIYKDSIIDIWDCSRKTCCNYYVKVLDIKPDNIEISDIHSLLDTAEDNVAYRIV